MKQRRCDLGYSIEDAAQASGIPQRHIRLLETEQLSRLPTFLYVKAFVRRYSAFLKLPPDAIISAFERIYAAEKHAMAEFELPQKKPLVRWNPRFLMRFVFVGLFAALIVYAVVQSSALFRSPFLAIEEPQQDIVVAIDEIAIHGRTDPQAELSLNGEQLVVDDSGVFNETVLLNEGVNTLTITASNRFHKTARKTIRVTFRPDAN